MALRRGGVVYYLHADHLGSLSEATTGASGLAARQRYRPYGQVRYLWGSLPTTYNFTGQRLDASTGLLYYGARYYDPALMRFTQPDTLVPDPANPQSLNRYAYVLNSPLKYTDPTGHANEPGGGLGGTCTGVQCLGPDWQVHWAGLHWWQLPSYVQTVAGLGPEGTALDAHSWDVEWGPAPGNATDVAGTLADPAVYVSAAAGGTASGLWKTVATGIGGWLSSTGCSLSAWCASSPVCAGIVFGAGSGAANGEGVFRAGREAANAEGPLVEQAAGISPWPAPWYGRQVVNGIEYTVHALNKMAPPGLGGRGVPPSAVENAIRYGITMPGREPGTVVHIYENVRVVTDELGRVVYTVIKTGH